MVQINQSKLFLRFKFVKKGSLQYISHLDLVRTMHKIIVRAKLPLWYTEGFNPKPKLVFAAPLSTGVESVCEFMDIRLTEKMDPKAAIEALNKNMTFEMQAIDAYYPEEKMTALHWLEYSIRINTVGASEKLVDDCREALNADEISILKKTKSGEAIVNIKPLIKSADVMFDGGIVAVRCVLSANSSSFLNPEYVVKVLREKCGVLSSGNLVSENYTILRTNAYREDMSEFR